MRRFIPGVIAIAILLPATAAAQMTTDALLDTVQESAFRFFWQEANPTNGLIKDRNTAGSVCSIASTGFGLSSICVGIDHGWITRAEGADRVERTLQTFWRGPQGPDVSGVIGYKGLFYHWLDMFTATRTWDSELSSIDTALLLAGIVDAQQYFATVDPVDVHIRSLADSIYQRMDWNWMRNGANTIAMGWKPGTGFSGYSGWYGYNEAMIMYLLALGAPTYPVPAICWSSWMSGYHWATNYGQSYVEFPPLFGHQYSHCWVDFRNIQDAYMRYYHSTYTENTRRATLAQQAYCVANPGGFAGYGALTWGLTACDGPSPNGYRARGAPGTGTFDDGTLAPTAVVGSLPFAFDVCLPTIQNLWDSYRPQIWHPQYGFRDAFNLGLNWWDTDVIGIDEGPIVLMIENYRTEAVWSRFMQNPQIQLGLTQAGFQTAAGVAVEPGVAAGALSLAQNDPNPFRSESEIRYRLATPGAVRLELYDVRGRLVTRLVDEVQAAGEHVATLRGAPLPIGVYQYRLLAGGEARTRKCVLVR